MATDLPPIYMEFKADISGLKESMGVIQGELKNFGTHASKAGKASKDMSAKTVAAGAVMANALIAMTSSAYNFAKETIGAFGDVAGEVRKMQRIMGNTPEATSRLRFAAKQVGVSADTISRSVRIVAKHITENDNAVKNLGISFRDANGKILPSDQIMGKLAGRFASMPNGLEKTALAVKLFGRSGTEMLPFLNLGADGLKRMSEQSDALGLTMGGEDLNSAKQYSMSMKNMHAAIEGVQVSIGKALIPKLTILVRMFSAGVIAIKDFVAKNTTLLKILSLVAGAVALVWTALKIQYYWTVLVTKVQKAYAIAQGIATAAAGAFSTVVGILTGEVALMSAPFWLVVVAIVAFVEILFYAIRHSKPFAEFLVKAITLVGKAYGTVIGFILRGLAALVSAWGKGSAFMLRTMAKLAAPFEKFGIKLGSGLEGAADAVERGTTSVSNKLTEWAEKAPDVGATIGAKIGNGIVAAANFDVMGWLKDKIKGFSADVTYIPTAEDYVTPELPEDPKKKKTKKPLDKVLEAIKAINAAIKLEDAQFQTALAQSQFMAFEERLAIIKAFMQKNTALIARAKAQEVATRGTKNHTAAVLALANAQREQAKMQKAANKLLAEQANAQEDVAKATKAVADAQTDLNFATSSSNSWLAAQVRTSGPQSANADSYVNVPVIIDGQTIFRVTQKVALQNNRRNVSNGLSVAGNLI